MVCLPVVCCGAPGPPALCSESGPGLPVAASALARWVQPCSKSPVLSCHIGASAKVVRSYAWRAHATAEPAALPETEEKEQQDGALATEEVSETRSPNTELASAEETEQALLEGNNEEVTKEDAAAGQTGTSAKKKSKKISQERRNKDWKRARELHSTGRLWRSTVEAVTSGGARLRLGSLVAFLPLSQIDPGRLQIVSNKTEDLVGQEITVQVSEVNEANGRLIVSERRALKRLALEKLQAGDVLDGVVSSVADYGAFVDISSASDGSPLSVTGLVHLSELSWNPVANANVAVTVGQKVRVKVISADVRQSRLALSLKQVEADPLSLSLDSLLPTRGENIEKGGATAGLQTPAGYTSQGDESPLAEELLGAALPGLGDLCEQLRMQEGVIRVRLGRQALEQRVVSQDLELWLANAPPLDNMFVLVARAGRQVQEVFVETTLDREGMKAAVLNVSKTVF